MKLGVKLTAAFLVVAIFVGATGLIGVMYVSSVGDSTDRIYSREYPVADASSEMNTALESELAALHAYLLGESEAEGEFNDASEEFNDCKDRISEKELTPDQRGDLTEIGVLHGELLATARDAFGARNDSDSAMVRTYGDMEEMDAAITTFLQAIEANGMSSDRMNTAWDEIMTPHDYIISGGDQEEKTIYADIQSRIEDWPDYSQVQTEHEDMVDRIDTVFESYDEHLQSESDMWAAMENVDAIAVSLSSACTAFEDVAAHNIAEAKAGADSNKDGSIFMLASITAVAFGASIGLGVLMARRIIGPVAKLAESSKSLAKGDFSAKIDMKASKDEIGQLVRDYRAMLANTAEPVRELNKASRAIARGDLSNDIDINAKGDMKELVDSNRTMLENLRALLASVQNTAGNVTAASQELASSSEQMNTTAQQVSASSQQISQGSANQAERVDDAAKIIGNMNSNADETTGKAKDAKSTSFKASEIANLGKESVDEAVVKMIKIQEATNSSAQVIRVLGEQSKEITQILDVITNITDQTNLLALNAAIEAARAGEHGRGFAVVAEEVKNLAEDSKEAADRIAAIISDIQSNTNIAVESMNTGTQEVSEGMEIVNKAGVALDEVAAMSALTAEMVEVIANFTEQQKAGTEMMATTIDEIATLAEQSASASEESAAGIEELTASMEEMASQTQELSGTAMELQRSTARFRGARKSDTSRRGPGRGKKGRKLRPGSGMERGYAVRDGARGVDAPRLPGKVKASLHNRGIELDERVV